MSENPITDDIVYWSLLTSSRQLMARHIHQTYTGETTVAEGIAAARAVLRERQAVDVRDLDRQRELTAEYLRRYTEMSGR